MTGKFHFVLAALALALMTALTPITAQAAPSFDEPVSLPSDESKADANDLRNLAIATLLYSTVASRKCAGFSLSETTYKAYMADNNLAPGDVDATSPRWGEIKESLDALEELFADENKAACDTAWMFMGDKGYLARGLLVGGSTAKQTTPVRHDVPARRKTRWLPPHFNKSVSPR